MRRIDWLAGVLALLGGGAAAALGACFSSGTDDCSKYPEDAVCKGWSNGSTDAGGQPDCTGDPTTDPAVVTDACGVFVNASAAPGGDGSQGKPFQTFAQAAAMKPARVFACAGSYTETEQVSFSGGVEVYGGFTGCTGTSWTWSASMQAQIATFANLPGVVLDGGANKLENVSVASPSATTPSASSIALLVNGGSLDMTNGALTAGDAMAGVAGTSPPDDPTLDGTTGANGANACDAGATHPGALGATNMCATGNSSTSGNGGDGGDPTGAPAGSGTAGTAMPDATAVGVDDGKGGFGEGQDATVACSVGDNGAPGAAGSSGAGASGMGTLTSGGYEGVAGQDGMNGDPGQGGGGGGGAKGAMSAMCSGSMVPVDGASGGAGGTGGCGGAAGGGGQAGGSSIALIAFNATVTLTNVTLAAGKGGNGGGGGDGQNGGQGGSGGQRGEGVGSAPRSSCQGGAGGQGGVGGPGGGGQGGYSLGIAFQGTKAPIGGTFMMGTRGTGGLGGTNNTATNMGQGADGIAASCWEFGKNMACM